MADEVSRFNTAPIMLRHPSSLVADDVLVNIYRPDQPSHIIFDEADEDECDIIDVPQNLAPEQYRYEFPPKYRLKELAHLDKNDDVFSFFDESSFTTASTSTAACSMMPLESDTEEDDDLAAFLMTMRSDHIPTSAVFRPADHASDQLDSLLDRYGYDHHLDDQYEWNPETAMIANEELQHHYPEDEMQLVDDGRLSPLQLPAQARLFARSPACNERRMREQSCDSTTTVTQTKLTQQEMEPVGPSSFLAVARKAPYASSSLDRVDEEDKFHWDESFSFQPSADRSLSSLGKESYLFLATRSYVFIVVQPYINSACSTHDILGSPYVHPHPHPHQRSNSEEELPIITRESELLTDSGSEGDNDSQFSSVSKIVIKLNRSKCSPATIIRRCTTSLGSDEGYDDEEDEKELPIESASVFLPLSDDEELPLTDQEYLRSVAATKIQALWRGYQCRRQPRSARKLFVNVVRMCGYVHQRRVDHMSQRIRQLEDRLREETAMRVAFENAMENMTVLIDKQQRSLYERVEREVDMRQAYERKIESVMAQVQPLETRLHKEAKARANLEDMMSRVIDQVHDLKLSQQQQMKEEAESKRDMQRKLDDALDEIKSLKQQVSQQQQQRQQQQQMPQMTRPVTPRTPAIPSVAKSTVRSSSPIRTGTVVRPKTAQAMVSRTTRTTTRTPQPSTKSSLKDATSTASRRTLVPSPSSRASSRLDSKRTTTVPAARRTLVSRK
ncbi:hypothetical protein EC973_008892 [Apophysomyces ossiformis]|uniref:Uncharacterized protein n=1 Tax=Apophysomyces ossiformis TaxID=679940 RepID=A0A8H7C0I2_9FUNG|nr:hypothetical protein EC973_008892 [Apophysomyces ossiformis]